MESILLDNNGKELPASKGAKGWEYINRMFMVKKEIEHLSFEEKKQKGEEASAPILGAFWSLVEKIPSEYTTNQREFLKTFLEDGKISLSTNLSKINIKLFSTSRRTWLFVDIPKYTKANAILYTPKKPQKPMNWMYINILGILERYLPW